LLLATPLAFELAAVSAYRDLPAITMIVLLVGSGYLGGPLLTLLIGLELIAAAVLTGYHSRLHLSGAELYTAFATVAIVSLLLGAAVTRQRRALAATEASEQRFHEVFAGAQIGLVAIDPAGWRVELVNPAFCEISARSASELIGDSATVLFRSEGAPLAAEDLLPGRLRHRPVRATIVRPDGESVIVDIVATLVSRVGGGSQLVATVTDLSEILRSAEELAESESRYRSLLEAAFDGVVLSVDGLIVAVNRGFQQLTGFSEQELIGRDLVALLAPESQAAGAAYRAAGASGLIEVVGVGKEGTTPIEVISQTVRYGGRAARLTAIKDVRVRRLAEAERAAVERRYRALFDSAGVAVALSDLDGTLLEVNGMLAELLGYTPTEMVGRKHESFADPLEERFRGGERDELVSGARSSYTAEHNLLRRDGTPLPTRITESLVRDEHGRPLHTVSVLESVAERRQLEEEIRQTQKMEAIGRLAGGIAHDFNNLLTVIGGQASLLAAHELAPAARSSVHEIEEAARRAAELTRQLLAFSRKQMMNPRSIDANDSITQLERLLRHVLPGNIEVELDLERELASVRVDPGQFDQVLMNLAINARDAMPDGGRLTISTSTVALGEGTSDLAAGSYVALTVSDTGVGMPEAIRARIFEPFFTTKRVGEGTGLGLATVYGIVSQSGGEVTVETEPGHGSSFRVFLPAAELRADAVAEAHVAPRSNPKGRRGRVLLVEDDPSVRRYAGDVLSADGHDVMLAASAEEALGLIADRDCTLDVLVTDLVMPGRSGRELAREVRERRPEVTVLYISGYAGANNDALAGAEQEAELIAKPFAPELISARVAEALVAARGAAGAAED
jgi:PAS domain S-box-containing protein